VSPSRREAAQRAPRTPLTLEPPSLLHLAAPFATGHRATVVALEVVTAADLRANVPPAELAMPAFTLGWASRCGPPWPCGLPRTTGRRSAEAMVMGRNQPDGLGNPFRILVSLNISRK
jgi:hypothetical protein